MAINYGSIEPKVRKKRQASNLTIPDADLDELTPEALKKRLLQLSKQSRYPAVATTAAKELLERIEPKKAGPEQTLTANEAKRIADIYDRLFGDVCPNCGHSGAAAK